MDKIVASNFNEDCKLIFFVSAGKVTDFHLDPDASVAVITCAESKKFWLIKPYD